MRQNSITLFLLFILFGAAADVLCQEPTGVVKNTFVPGEVVSVVSGKIVLKTADGSLDVILSDATVYMRVPPENPVLKAAVAASFGDIGEGDKLLVSGLMPADKKSIPAKTVYLITKADIADRQAKEREKWSTRAISGKVTAVDLIAKTITVEVRGLTGATSITLTPKQGAKFLRYAPNSVRFSEAVSSSFIDIAVDDMLRSVGDRSQDGKEFAAEEVLTGAFQTVAGTVKSVDVEKNEIVITELQSKKDITVSLAAASLLKKFPEQMAQMMAARPGMAGGMPPGAGGRPGGGQGQPSAGGQGGQPGRPGGMGQGMPGGGSRGGIDEMLDRFPNVTAAGLTIGEMVAISSSKTSDSERVTAIKLLAGVEPFIRASQAASGGRRGGGTQSLDIPGLDGFSMPGF